MVAKRRKRRPNMHIYHYAPYEKTALLRLAGRYGVGEDEVDELLRSGTLVDLYPLVRKSIRVGAESFSLKALEPLYMGTQLRSGDVTTATDSITSYAKYCELGDAGRLGEAETVLKEIEDYNHYDCRSTQELRNWLLVRAWEAGVIPVGAQPVPDGNTVEDHDELAAALSAFTGDAAVGDRTPEQIAVALVAAARGYHRREDKPFWWAHFDRLNFPVDEWADNTDVFVCRRRVGQRRLAYASARTQAATTGDAARRTGPRRPDDGRVCALRGTGSAQHERQPRPARGRAGQGCRSRRPGSAHRSRHR